MPTSQLSVPSPGPRWISVVSLFLRASVGIHLIRIGAASYLARLVLRPGPRASSFLLPGAAPNLLVDVFQYLAIAIGLALALGFFTRVAAASMGVMLLIGSALQLFFDMSGGISMPTGGNPILAVEQLGIVQVRQYMSIQLIILIWIAAPVNNLYSLDGLMFLKKRLADKPRDATEPAGPRLTGGSIAVVDTFPRHEIPANTGQWVPRELDFSDPEFGVSAETSRDPS